MDLDDFGKFIIAYALLCIALLTLLISLFVKNENLELITLTSTTIFYLLCIFGYQSLLLYQLNDLISKIETFESLQL